MFRNGTYSIHVDVLVTFDCGIFVSEIWEILNAVNVEFKGTIVKFLASAVD